MESSNRELSQTETETKPEKPKEKIYSADFYPFYGSKGGYREPQTYYLTVEGEETGFEFGLLMDDKFSIDEFTNSRELVTALSLLPSGSWVLTYDLSTLTPLFNDFINIYDNIKGYSTETRTLTLEIGESRVFVVDLFQFLGDSLSNALIKAGEGSLGRALESWSREKTTVIQYATSRIMGIAVLWQDYRGILKELYNVHPSKTPGSTALKIWKTRLTESFTVRGKSFKRFGFMSYLGGALHYKNGYYHNAYHYDINASYPHVMRVLSYPLDLIGFTDDPPPEGARWIATVKINYKTDWSFSPLATRVKDIDGDYKVMHPVNARGLRVTLTYIDVETLRLAGELEIVSWVEGVYWFPEMEKPIFRDWVNEIETRLLEHPSEKALLKVTTRSLHSKFAQRPGYPEIEIRRFTREETERSRIVAFYPLEDGDIAAKIATRRKPRFQPYIRPEWEALTLSMGRYLLYSAMDQNTVYVDTDSIISTEPREDLLIGNRFGEWKNQGEGKLYVAGPRMYVFGDKPKAAGIRAEDIKELTRALKNATSGKRALLNAMESGSVLNPENHRKTRDHSIVLVKYPHVTVNGIRAFVTRSPTIQLPVKYVRRVFS